MQQGTLRGSKVVNITTRNVDKWFHVGDWHGIYGQQWAAIAKSKQLIAAIHLWRQ